MKIFHISDLHIGKQLNGYSLKENQERVLGQIVEYGKAYRPEAVLICGDIYDKTAPSGEAYTMFDQFLTSLSRISPETSVLIIAGNHDSPERLAYASSFLEQNRIYVAAMPPAREDEHIKRVVLHDEFGPVNFYLLPFLKPGYVRGLLKEGEGDSYDSAVRGVIGREEIDQTERNVLLSHQFYTARGQKPSTCDSEQAVLMAGGIDQVEASVLAPFDYAALGHLHGAQRVGEERFRYSGTPCKYSVSEENHKKAVTLITLGPKGEKPKLESLPLFGLLDVRREKGSLNELLKKATEENRHDFVSVTLTDEEEPYRMRERLLEVYDHLLELKVENERTRRRLMENEEAVPVLRPFDAFLQFYEAVRHEPMGEKALKAMERIIEEAKEEEGL